MSALRRIAILAAVIGAVGSTAACEALVGISDREVAPEGGADAAVVGMSSGGTDTGGGDGMDSTVPEAGGDDGTTGTGSDSGPGMDAIADAGVGVGNDSDGGADIGAGSQPGVDAGDGGDGAVLDPDLPCSQQGSVLFCDDFDTSTTPGQNWDTIDTLSDSGVATLDTTDYVSSPKSVQIVASPVTGGTGGVQLIKSFSSVPGGIRVALDFRIDSATYTSFPQTCVGQLYIRQGSSTQAQVNLVVGPGSTSALQASVPDAGAMQITASAPAMGSWVRAVISYMTDGTLSLYENNQLVGSINVGGGPGGTVLFIGGTAYIVASGTETVTLETDNVVVKAQ